MKICISSTDDNLESQLDLRFGRCQYFLIIDTDNNDLEVIDNQNNALGGGAGVKAARQIIDKGAEAVITGKCGPKAVQAFDTAGVVVITGQKGSVKGVVNAHLNGKLKATTGANLVLDVGMGGHGHGPGQCTCHQRSQQTGKGAGNETCRTDAH